MFSRPDVIRVATDDYVAVAVNDFSLYRRRDAEGDFFRRLVAPIPLPFPTDPSRQGIYCLSAGGRMLAYERNLSPRMDAPALLRQGLEAFARLPALERLPGAVAVADRVADPRADAAPPPGGLILRVYTRRLQRSGGDLQPSTTPLVNHGLLFAAEPQIDHMWLSRDECAALIPRPLRAGAHVPMPAAVAQRLCRYHLADTTWEGSEDWKPEEILSQQFTLTVDRVLGSEARIDVRGHAVMARGRLRRLDARLEGHLLFDARRRSIRRFDMVASGTLESDQGSTPLGFAFERADGSQVADRVPPHDSLVLREWAAVEGLPEMKNLEPAFERERSGGTQ